MSYINKTSIVIMVILLLTLPTWLLADDAIKAITRKTKVTETHEKNALGDLYAVVVGISDYKHPKIPDLKVSHKDAEDIAAFLKSQTDLFKNVHVELLTNEKATQREVGKLLYYKLRDAGKDDTIVVFLSGHGTDDPNNPGEYFFLTYDSDPDYLAPTAIHMNRQWFLEKLDSKRVVLIADACHAGGFGALPGGRKAIGGSFGKLGDLFRDSQGKIFISSSRPEEYSQEKPEKRNSVFTYYLLRGLKGEADRDKDGLVALKELYDFVYYKTKSETHNRQRPMMEGQLSGTFPMAVAPAGHAPLPQPTPKKTPAATSALEARPAKDVERLKKRANNGNPQAQFELGLKFEYGLSVSKSRHEALRWYQKAADQGYGEAVNALSRLGSLEKPIPNVSMTVETLKIDKSLKMTRDQVKALKRFVEAHDVVKKNYVKQVDSKELIEGAIRALSASMKGQKEYSVGKILEDLDRQSNKINYLGLFLLTLQRQYETKARFEDLVTRAIGGMIQSIDPSSCYLDERMFKELQIETREPIWGIGVDLTFSNGMLTVVSPIEDSPGDRAGLQAGDRIVKIDGKSTKNMSLLQVVEKTRGPKNKSVVLTIVRDGFGKPEDFFMAKDIIHCNPLKKFELEKGYVYIKIGLFCPSTTKDLKKAIEEFSGLNRIKGVVLDLRNNPGGLKDKAVEIADLFLRKGLIVYTSGRSENRRMEFRARTKGKHYDFKLALLLNEGSASASEILAGAVQYHNRGIIVGTQSFGKASAKDFIRLKKGDGIWLTTAYYHTPKGRIIQQSHIVPDLDLRDQVEKKIAKPFDPQKDMAIKIALDWLKSDATAQEFRAKSTGSGKKSSGANYLKILWSILK